MKQDIDKSLYLVLTSTYNKEIDILDIAEEACKGGIDILQMREKYARFRGISTVP